MSEAEETITARLVARSELGDTDAQFVGAVHRIDTALGGRIRHLTLSSKRYEYALVSIGLSNYYILGVCWKPGLTGPIEYTEFSPEPEEQNEALEILQNLLNNREDTREAKPTMGLPEIGPRRIELRLYQKSIPGLKKRLVVTNILPPKDSFKYWSVAGRFYTRNDVLEETVIQGLSSTQWAIDQVEIYTASQKISTCSHFTSGTQPKAWERVETLMNSFSQREIAIVVGWDVDGEEDETALYGGQRNWQSGTHYTQRVPNHYQYEPPVGAYRVAGDSEGARNFLENSERIVALPAAERRIVDLPIQEYLEKKAGAEAAKEEASATDDAPAKSDGNSGGGDVSGGNPDSVCGVCATLGVAACEEHRFGIDHVLLAGEGWTC